VPIAAAGPRASRRDGGASVPNIVEERKVTFMSIWLLIAAEWILFIIGVALAEVAVNKRLRGR
ncbi:MAG: hypothetical protein ACRDFS_13250, partial [Chloroflexota bacterium]